MRALALLPLLALAACADDAPEAPVADAPAAAVATVDVASPEALAAVLPVEVAGAARGEVTTAADSALGVSTARAEAAYDTGGAAPLRVVVADYGGPEMLALMGLRADQVPDRSGRRMAVVADRFVVQVTGDDDALDAALEAVDVVSLEALAR